MEKGYDEIKEGLNIMRGLFQINEEASEGDSDAIPYGNEDELYQNVVNAARTQVGADFTGCKYPMLYYPSNGDVMFSGRIPTLNDAKFQFHFRDVSETKDDGTVLSMAQGCYIWVENLVLTDDSLSTLSKLLGVFKNWQNELKTSSDIQPIKYKQH